jgi:hypothetical protein
VCAPQGLQACAGLDNTLEAVLSRVLFDDSRGHTHGAAAPPMASERLFTRAVQTGAHVLALVNVLGTCLPKLTAEHPPPTEEQSAAATSGAPANLWRGTPCDRGYRCPRVPAPLCFHLKQARCQLRRELPPHSSDAAAAVTSRSVAGGGECAATGGGACIPPFTRERVLPRRAQVRRAVPQTLARRLAHACNLLLHERLTNVSKARPEFVHVRCSGVCTVRCLVGPRVALLDEYATKRVRLP